MTTQNAGASADTKKKKLRKNVGKAIAFVKASFNNTIISITDSTGHVIAWDSAGARGYVTKTISGTELADAVRRVAGGDAVFSPRLAGFVLDSFTGRSNVPEPPLDPELDSLTPRELEVLRLLARGYTYREIAEELVISVKTVETHASNVLRKTQQSNRNALTRWAHHRRID